MLLAKREGLLWPFALALALAAIRRGGHASESWLDKTMS